MEFGLVQMRKSFHAWVVALSAVHPLFLKTGPVDQACFLDLSNIARGHKAPQEMLSE